MAETDLPIHLFFAAGILGMDIIAAGILFLFLQHREHPLTFVIPAFILIAGVVSAILVYFMMGNPPG